MTKFVVVAQHAMSDYEETFVEEASSEEVLERRLLSMGYDVYSIEEEVDDDQV